MRRMVVNKCACKEKKNLKTFFKYKLTFMHKFVSIALIVLSFVFLMSPQAYEKTLEYDQVKAGLSFLQKGEYVVEIEYMEASEDNAVVFYSEEMLNENNELYMEFLRIDVGSTGGVYRGQLFLEQNVHGLAVKTDLDTESENYIRKVSIQSVQLESRDNYFLAVIFLMCAIFTFLLGLCLPMEKYIEIVIVIGMAVIASIPVFTDFVTKGHDMKFHIGRLEALAQGLMAGEFPVYLGSTEMGGFGTLSSTMYPQLFLYPVAALRFVNISLMMCYKILLLAINVITALASYYAAKNMFHSTKIATWTSLLYTFSIYRLVNVYFRAAIGEALAMAFLPLVIWGAYEVFWGNNKKWYVLAVGMSGVLQSHVLSTGMCVIFLVMELFVWLLSGKGERHIIRIVSGIKAAVLTVFLNAFFLVPFLFFCTQDLQCFNMPDVISDTGVYFSQIFGLFANYAGWTVPAGKTINEMPLTIGVILLIGSILLVWVDLLDKNQSREVVIGRRCFAYGVIAVFMASYIFPWDYFQEIPWLKDSVTSIQFAWRFLGPASVLLCFASAAGVVLFTQLHADRKWVYGLFVALIVSSTSYFFGMKGADLEYFPQYSDKMEFTAKGEEDYLYMYTEWGKFLPVSWNYTWDKAYILSQMSADFKVENLRRNGMHMKMTVTGSSDIDDKLMLPFYYYPGYVAYIDGEEVPVESLARRVGCPMPKDTAEVEVYYKGLPSFMYANWVTVITVICVCGYGGYSLIKKKPIKRKEE